MKKIIAVSGGIILAAAFFFILAAANAEENSESAIKPIISGVDEKDLRQEISVKEIRGRIVCQAIGNCPSDNKPSTEVLIKAAKVTEVGSGYIVVSVFDYNGIKIDISSSKLVRQYWGESSINEFSIGDIVNVFGYLDPVQKYLIHAQTVRNVSIQKLQAVFKGTIESINASSSEFVLKTGERGNQTVVVNSQTKITKSVAVTCVKAPCPPIETLASFSDLAIGMKVVVRGIWNKTLSKTEASVILIAGESNPRPFLKQDTKDLKKIEKLEQKAEKFEKKESEKKSDESAESMMKKIEEIQKKIAELTAKLKTATTTQ